MSGNEWGQQLQQRGTKQSTLRTFRMRIWHTLFKIPYLVKSSKFYTSKYPFPTCWSCTKPTLLPSFSHAQVYCTAESFEFDCARSSHFWKKIMFLAQVFLFYEILSFIEKIIINFVLLEFAFEAFTIPFT